MERFEELDTVRARVWRRLSEAAGEPGHPYRTLTFGTTQDDIPRLRTVVLRQVGRAARRLAFHSDRRAQKIDDIRAAGRIAWQGWDPDTAEQVRLGGTATVHTDDAVADAMWAEQNPSSLDVYVRPAAPGTPVDDPDEGVDPSVAEEPVAQADVEAGRPHFAVVRTVIDKIDWLHLHPKGHVRARFVYDPGAGAFDGTWIVP